MLEATPTPVYSNPLYDYVTARQKAELAATKEYERNPPKFDPLPPPTFRDFVNLYVRLRKLYDEVDSRRHTASLDRRGLPGHLTENYSLKVAADGLAQVAEEFAKATRQTFK